MALWVGRHNPQSGLPQPSLLRQAPAPAAASCIVGSRQWVGCPLRQPHHLLRRPHGHPGPGRSSRSSQRGPQLQGGSACGAGSGCGRRAGVRGSGGGAGRELRTRADPPPASSSLTQASKQRGSTHNSTALNPGLSPRECYAHPSACRPAPAARRCSRFHLGVSPSGQP